MDIYRLFYRVTWLFHDPDFELDYVDDLIQDALLDDALACPSAGAWERLRQVIIQRQIKNYGMWVLDEPQRDPPEAPPMLLSCHDFARAQRLYGNCFPIGSDLRRDVIWGGLLPTFSVMVNW